MPCPEVPNPITERPAIIAPPPDPDPEPEIEWSGFTILSDVHACTQQGGAQQSAPLQIACLTLCDDIVCGGPGGFLVWYSNNPEELEQGCSHPNNPIPGLLS